MIYLLAEYTVVFLLTAALGFLLGYWWSRRNIVDVTESYENLVRSASQSTTSNWDQLWQRLDLFPQPQQFDIGPVLDRISGVEQSLLNMPKPVPVNMKTVEQRLASLTEAVGNIPIPITPKEAGFAEVNRNLQSLDERLAKFQPQDSIDLEPVNTRLLSIETEVAKLGKRLDWFARESKPILPEHPVRAASSEEPVILSAALYGKKDDLTLISGVGPKLEMLLNKNGVYYFWQVASWSTNDIEVIDERLDAFKGRIFRDDWVTQAERLSSRLDAAQMPAD